MVISLPWHQTGLYRTSSSVEDVLDRSLGIYSTQPTGHLELAARVNGYRLDELTRVVEADRSAVRLRSLRGSSFVIPTSRLPVTQAATRARNVRSVEGYLRKNLATDYETWTERVEEVLAGKVMAPTEIKPHLEPLGDDARWIRYVLAMMSYENRIVAATVTGTWRSDRTTFALWSEWLPDVDVWSMDAETARRDLARIYLDRHGPATIADFSFWSGIPKGQAKAALESAADPLDGSEFWATGPVQDHAPPPVRLLPIWDTLFVTYRERSRFVADDHYPFVYDKSGNATSVVLVDGWAAGVWDLGKDDQRLTIKVAPFDTFSTRTWAAIDEEAHHIGTLIGSESVTVTRGSDPIDLTTRPQNTFMSPLKESPSPG
jgi:hypothetical protein